MFAGCGIRPDSHGHCGCLMKWTGNARSFIRIGKDAAGKNRFKRLDLAKGSIRNKVLAAINTDELDHIFDTDGVFED